MSWWERFIDWWTFVKVWIALLLGATAYEAIYSVWGNRRPVGDFFEEFVARFLNLGMPIIIFGAAIYAGTKAASKANSAVVGWIVGLAVLIAVGFLSYFAISQVPGVSWRFDRLQENRY